MPRKKSNDAPILEELWDEQVFARLSGPMYDVAGEAALEKMREI